ncbi:MAG: Hsp20/alpha crystallin family protein [Patescibacteria group bacterium]
MISIFERITGTISLRGRSSDLEEEVVVEESPRGASFSGWDQVEQAEGELAVDVYQTNEAIIIQAMVAGVSSDELTVSATREMVTIKGKRGAPTGIASENYFYQELYWGTFSRTILLPSEVEAEEVEATERHGLLTIKLPKLNKGKIKTVRIKSL